MLAKIFLFEWRFFVRQPSFYVTTLSFFTLAFLASSLNQISMGGGSALKNGPFLIGQIMSFFNFFSMFVAVNFVAGMATRNRSTQMAELLYCKPINPLHYRLGRFLGAFAVVVAVASAVPFGLLIGSFMPWVDAARFGPTDLSYYFCAFLYLSVPTLFVLSCIFYAFAVRFKSMMPVYLAAVAVFMASEIGAAVFHGPQHRMINALIDPFAINAFAEVSRYWTIAEKNSLAITLDGVLLQNRLLWLGVGLAAMGVFGGLFRPLSLNLSSKKSKGLDSRDQSPPPVANCITYTSNVDASKKQLLARTVFEIRQVIISPAFYVLGLISLVVFAVMLAYPQGMFGGALWPLTQIMVEVIQRTMGSLILIVIAYYSAEIVWRERSSGIGDVIDSMPVPNVVFWLSKLVAMWSVVALLLLLGTLVTITYQLASGYHGIELQQYFVSLFFFTALPWSMVAVLAFFLQIVSPNKYVGMCLFVLYILSGLVMEPLGLSHNMFRFSQSPSLTYSDLNGYGPALVSHSWYMLYWGGLSLAMGVVGYGLWHRGPQQRIVLRLRKLSYQIGTSGKVALAAAVVIFAASGSTIYYNTRVLNEFVAPELRAERRAAYEKKYARYADTSTPAITRVDAQVDIFPQQRKIVATAGIVIENTGAQPIRRFLVSFPEYTPHRFSVEIAGGRLGERDGALNTYWFEFEHALQPGEQRHGTFEVTRQSFGFVDRDEDIQVVKNGTFINNSQLFPLFGYVREYELVDGNERRKYDLSPPMRANKLEDSRYYNRSSNGTSSNFIEFEATVSTSLDQVAIAPGYLQREWRVGNRRYFHYKMDAPIENRYAFLSARLNVFKEQYNGVSVEVYYHPSHGMNVERMATSIKDSIDYFGKNFGPYQHRQARIIEFPGYQEFAQSFANTIPYSERIGFIYDIRDASETDSVYFVTAHEMAHQWWGGQVGSADVQGSAVIIETLAHYSALMVTEKKYGWRPVRYILKYELDRYLRGRTRELVEELPLMRAENQPYIHYRKGVVVMMSLRDLLGEERLNSALREFLAAFQYSSAPYPTTLDLKRYLEKGTSVQERTFIASMFEEIALYDLRATDITSEPLDSGGFLLRLTVDAHRVRADGEGTETEVALLEPIDIGLFSEDPDHMTSADSILYLQKHTIRTGQNVIELSVPQLPSFAGIDPFVRLIDRDSGDNVIEL